MTPQEASPHRGVYVYLESLKGRALPVGFELLGKGREMADRLGEPLVGILAGRDLDQAAQEAVARGADEVLLCQDPRLEPFVTEAHAKVVSGIVQHHRPNILLFGATHNGRDLAGRLAVRLRTGLTAHATRLDVDVAERLLLAAVPGFGGSILAVIKTPKGRPQMSTVAPGLFAPLPADGRRRGRVHVVPVALEPQDLREHVLDRTESADGDVSGADLVIVAGLGVAGDLSLVHELGRLLHAPVCATRPLVDLGLFPRERQVGSSGISLTGKVAIVVGASGATHLVSGLRRVDTVIAINKDPTAPIFGEADLGIVADAEEVLRPIVEALRVQEVTA